MLHEGLVRHMENTGVEYRNIQLPEKVHLFNSGDWQGQRHKQLRLYLEGVLCSMKQLHRIHAFNHFMGAGEISRQGQAKKLKSYIE